MKEGLRFSHFYHIDSVEVRFQGKLSKKNICRKHENMHVPAAVQTNESVCQIRNRHGKEIMKYIQQFLWILLFSFAGEILKYVIPMPVPASIYGFLLLLLALLTGILRLESVKEVSMFLIEIMTLMFIPAAVGLLESWSALSGIFMRVLVTIAVSTILVMGVSGRVTQALIRRRQRGRE